MLLETRLPRTSEHPAYLVFSCPDCNSIEWHADEPAHG